ncbi:unnamed protein product [Prorocentrum cordatum]|uniref:Uncharacterized protein n=1 Tax=Prorocentrum cordatum TaxID=2364126 RepID=A0ABN9WVQ0_9DINO|nr:unnamed protein product [Polarella glacialis]
MVDARLLNKPRAFAGPHSEWFDFEAHAYVVHPRLGGLIHQASLAADVVAPRGDAGKALNAKLYCILVSVTSGAAKVEVREAPRGDGLAAGRHLLREFAPKEARWFAAALGRVIRHEFPDPVVTTLAEVEQLVRERSDQSCDVISDNMKRGAIIPGIEFEMLPDHLGLNATRLATHGDLKNELKMICSAQQRWAAPGAGGDGAVPAQVDASGEGKGMGGQKRQRRGRQRQRRGRLQGGAGLLEGQEPRAPQRACDDARACALRPICFKKFLETDDLLINECGSVPLRGRGTSGLSWVV